MASMALFIVISIRRTSGNSTIAMREPSRRVPCIRSLEYARAS